MYACVLVGKVLRYKMGLYEVSKMESTAPVTPERPAAKKWTKTVQCDEHKVSYR
jgi:hypothetical protein